MTNDERAHHERRLDFGTKAVLVICTITFFGVIAAVGVGVLTRGDTQAQLRSDQQAACITVFNGMREQAERDLERTKAVHDEEVDRAEDLRDDLFLQAVVAGYTGQTEVVDEIARFAPEVQTQLDDAREARTTAVLDARDHVDTALGEYVDAGRLRQADPDRFLELCDQIADS